MSLTVDEVRRIASLAGLRVGPEEARRLVPEMEGIVRFVEEMGVPEGGEVSLASSAPVAEAEDVPAPGLEARTVLENAPDRRQGFVRLPPVRPVRPEREEER